MSIGINGDIEKIKALEDNILDQYNKNVELADKMEQETEKFAKQANTAIEDYNSNAETKTEEFNTNVKEKTDEFNSNATEKETEISDIADGFDANVEEKTNTFNSNVETKTTEFNNNSNAKTEEFNNNSTEKINNFNSNAEEKIADYNEHVETLTSRIADLEEETDDLFNALNTEKASGNDLYIEDAKPCRIMNTEIGGMYKQNQTKGLNFFDITGYTDRTVNGINIKVKDDGTLTLNGVCTVKKTFINIFIPEHIIPAGTYTRYMSYAEKIKSFLTLALSYNNTTIPNTSVQPSNQYITSTYNDDITYNQIKLYIPNTDVTFNNIIVDPMIVKGEYTANNAPKYEPYTGGNPSPNRDYPQAIEQVESVILKSVNKNWYPFNDIKITSEKTTAEWVFVDGAAGAYGTTIGNKTSYKFKLLKGVYTIKCSKTNSNVVTFQIVDERERIYMNLSTTNFTTTITLNEDKILIVRIRLTNPSLGADISDLQIEKGTTATNYEPSQNKAINVDLKGNKLCAISDTIKDKLLIDRNGNVALQKNVEKNIFDGTKKWKKSSYTKNTIFYLANTQKAKSSDVGICNFFPVKRVWGTDILGLELYDLNNIRVGLTRNSEIQTEDAFNGWLTTHNLEVYYALATPEIIDLGQLTELPKTFDGINNIWAETNIGNTEIEIEYVQDVKKLLEKQVEQQNARLDNIEALLSTTQTSALLLDNMQTDLEKEVE